MTFNPSEMAVLRKSAAQWQGTSLPKSISGRLRIAFKRFRVLRNSQGKVVGFGRDGFVLTPKGAGLYGWNETRQRLAHING